MTETRENTDTCELGEYITSAIRGEINRTQSTATCLLTVLSFVGTAASAGLAATARDEGIELVVTLAVLGTASVLLGAALVSILLALRPRLPKNPAQATGWPLIPHLSREEYEAQAREFGEFLRCDAITLAGIASTKFRLIRRAYTSTIAGLPILLIGLLLWI